MTTSLNRVLPINIFEVQEGNILASFLYLLCTLDLLVAGRSTLVALEDDPVVMVNFSVVKAANQPSRIQG